MNEIFKILIAYDGSACSDAALEDLRLAGLHETDVEALTISVAEVWLPPSNSETESDSNFLTESLRQKRNENLRIFEETKDLKAVVDRLVELTMENVPVASDFTMSSRPVTATSTISK